MLARVYLRHELRSLASFKPLSSLSLSSSSRLFSSTASTQADFSHVVIGGGVIGLAIARSLSLSASRAPGNPQTHTLLVERHPQVGTETSSRNSEVIHAGLYYGPGTLKTRLCVRGREALYAFCAARGVAHRRTGKWIVAQDRAELESLERIAAHCRSMSESWGDGDGDGDGDGGSSGSEGSGSGSGLRAPVVRFLGKEEARRLEPDVRAEAGVLESPETGIVDSHGLMLALQGLFEDAGGVTALGSEVVGIEPIGGSTSDNNNNNNNVPGSSGWKLTIRDTTTHRSDGNGNAEESTITTETVINSAGLGAGRIHNLMVRDRHPERRVESHYAKGSYFSYGASSPRVSRLIYPAPAPGHAGLGTHLTLDLAGRVRFGPDAEWVDGPADLAVSAGRLPRALAEIRRYLPGVDGDALAPDYAGIRPKLGRLSGTNTNTNNTDGGKGGSGGGGGGGGGGFQDFYIKKEEGFEGWVNLLGMESPGLTSCLAIADYVRDLLYASQNPKP